VLGSGLGVAGPIHVRLALHFRYLQGIDDDVNMDVAAVVVTFQVGADQGLTVALLKTGKAKVKKLYPPETGKTYDGLVLFADTGGKYVNYLATVSRDRELTQQQA